MTRHLQSSKRLNWAMNFNIFFSFRWFFCFLSIKCTAAQSSPCLSFVSLHFALVWSRDHIFPDRLVHRSSTRPRISCQGCNLLTRRSKPRTAKCAPSTNTVSTRIPDSKHPWNVWCCCDCGIGLTRLYPTFNIFFFVFLAHVSILKKELPALTPNTGWGENGPFSLVHFGVVGERGLKLSCSLSFTRSRTAGRNNAARSHDRTRISCSCLPPNAGRNLQKGVTRWLEIPPTPTSLQRVRTLD